MKRNDVLAAKVFAGALAPETIEAMQKSLLRKAGRKAERPDPTTRLGLALIAFTTPDIAMPRDDEVAEALARVAPLWTESERERSLE